MYSNKENVNILTSLLVAHGVRHAVVCPGSRNAAIVHNLNECEDITCYPVTDERSAGFQALGLSMAEGYQPVVVCVTSGSALLNFYPAVAEAYYQQIPLIVISADRPAQWINQLDGQTLPQPDALGQMVRKAVSLPEVFEGEQQEEMHWYCNRLVNEALLKSMGRVKGPVHINVPISEPFYSFTKEALPVERKIEVAYCRANIDTFDGTPFECVLKAKRPLLVIGQLDNTEKYVDLLAYIDRMPILWESLAMPPYLYKVQEELGEDWNKTTLYGAFENLLDEIKDDERFRPDLVRNTESHLKEVGAPLAAQSKPKKNHPDIVEQVAPKAIEVDAAPMDIVITRPNFWTIGGDYYLQFLQNYVSDNWYKGGESNYSVLGRVTMFANYNNKQKIKWDNKVEMRLGYQTSKGDTVHTLKTSDDMIRYTGKLGLQASRKWYYTIQLIGQTQFTHGYKSNDKTVYSDFFSPFNLNLSVGMDYNVDWFNHRLKGSAHLAPLAFNWKYVGRASLATRYGLDEGKHGMTDYGSECTFDLSWQIADNIKWKTRLWGYTTYKRAEIEWENTITFQFNRYISTNIFLYPRFDDGVKRKDDDSYWQFKEFMSVGFSYSF